MSIPEVSIKRILYATDLSENARNAFAYALSMAKHYGATLTIVHVIYEDFNLDEAIRGYVDAKKWEDIKRRNIDEARQRLLAKRRDHVAIREVLSEFSEQAKADTGSHELPFRTDEILVLHGHPVTRILESVEERKCDMIVMGSHGHGTLKDAMLGSTTQKVVRRSPVPVLVVRLPEE